jgi:hypothetical protein
MSGGGDRHERLERRERRKAPGRTQQVATIESASQQVGAAGAASKPVQLSHVSLL